MNITHDDLDLRPMPLAPGHPWWAPWRRDPAQLYLVRDDYRITIDGEEYRVPAGTLTDGASIPVALWGWLGHPFQSRSFGQRSCTTPCITALWATCWGGRRTSRAQTRTGSYASSPGAWAWA